MQAGNVLSRQSKARTGTKHTAQLGRLANDHLLSIWITLNAIDAVATCIAVKGGGREINPLLSLAIAHLDTVPAMVLKLVLAVLLGIYVLRINRTLILIVNVMMTAVVFMTVTSAILAQVL